MKLISVIVPVYNVEVYLEKCLQTIIEQTYKNLEILLVDDGSTDNSGSICDLYAKKDQRIIVVHKENGGLSDARNAGIMIAKGEYISFVDSDDFLSPNYMANLVKLIERTDAEIAITCAFKFYDESNCSYEKFDESLSHVYSSEDALKDLLYRKNIPIYAVAKLYHRCVFCKIMFPKGELFEDLSTQYLFFHEACKIVFNPVRDYFYRQRKDSIINSKFDIRKMIQIESTEKIIQFVRKNYPSVLGAAKSKCLITTINLYRTIPYGKEYKEQRNLAKVIVKRYRKDVLKDKENKIFTRIIAASSFFGLDWIKMVSHIYQTLIENEIIKLEKPI